MEQIQILQPKMPAAQSFIQILGTFLAILINFKTPNFSYIKKITASREQLKPLVLLDLSSSNITLLVKIKKKQR